MLRIALRAECIYIIQIPKCMICFEIQENLVTTRSILDCVCSSNRKVCTQHRTKTGPDTHTCIYIYQNTIIHKKNHIYILTLVYKHIINLSVFVGKMDGFVSTGFDYDNIYIICEFVPFAALRAKQKKCNNIAYCDSRITKLELIWRILTD